MLKVKKNGEKNAMLKVARNMLSKNASIEEIKAMTNLADTEIAQLINVKV